MKRLLNFFIIISILYFLIIAPFVISSGQASAETTKGTDASYVGANFESEVANNLLVYTNAKV